MCLVLRALWALDLRHGLTGLGIRCPYACAILLTQGVSSFENDVAVARDYGSDDQSHEPSLT
ncbi:unnamed protein product [Camellia sinensis]